MSNHPLNELAEGYVHTSKLDQDKTINICPRK